LAYIKINEGCDHPCTFCLIPQFRGGFRSRRFESVILEATRLFLSGIREINLIGKDTTAYGEDLGIKNGLPSLLDRLAADPDHAFVSRDPGIEPGQASGVADVVGPVVRGPERIDLSVDLAAPGLLVLNHAPFPGWSAEVNGRPAEILTVNMVSRGLALPAGAHEITMRFEPPGFSLGVTASLVATGLLVPLLAVGVWRQRR